MKLHFSHVLASAIGYGGGAALLLHAADAQTTYPCPPAGSSTPLTDTLIRVPIVTGTNSLCLLLRRDSATGSQRAPVARSYAGREWEQSAGLFAKTGSGVSVDCSGGAVTECDVTLPPLEGGMEFVLESYEYESTSEAEAARFLEQVSLLVL